MVGILINQVIIGACLFASVMGSNYTYIVEENKPQEEVIEVQEVIVEVVEEVVPEEPEFVINEDEAIALAQMVWGEALHVESELEKQACMWTVINRVGNDGGDWGIIDAVSAPNQYHGYSPYNPVDEHLLEMARYVLTEWEKEKAGLPADRVIAPEYKWFSGNMVYNTFRDAYSGPSNKIVF